MTFALTRPVAFMLALAATIPAADTLSLIASDTVVANGADVTITVNINADTSYSVWGQVLKWDTSKLELRAQVVVTSPLGSIVDDSRTLSDIDSSGEVRTGGYYADGAPPYVNNASATGPVARFTFRRKASGSTTLTVAKKDGSNPFGAVLINAAGSERTPTTNATVTLTDPVSNSAPVITEGASVAVTMDEDATPTSFARTLNATDGNGADTLTWSVSTAATHGTATVTGTGLSKAIAYTPTANYAGSDSFVVQVSDGNGGTDTITVNVTITPRNDAPANTAVPTVTGTKTVGQTLTATTGTWNDTIDTANGGTSTITYAYLWQRADNASGTNIVDITTATAATYVLAAGDAGKFVRVRVTGTDNGIGLPATQSTIAYSAWSTAAISTSNVAPVITEGGSVAVTMDEDGTPTAFARTLNVTDGNSADTLTWSVSTAATHGTATVTGTGLSKAIAYTPTANYAGSDSFVVQVSDGNSGTDTITVNVTVTPRNDAPVNTAVPTVTGTNTVGQTLTASTGAWNDTIDTANGGSSTITYTYLWQRADNASGDNTVDITTATAVTYVLAAGDAGKYVRVRVTGTDNGIGQPATQSTVAYSAWSTAAISTSNVAPVITEGASVAVTMDEDGTPTAFARTLNATDGNSSDTLTWSISTAANHGTATVTGTGLSKAIAYAPTANYAGSDSFVVQVSDGNGGTDTITVNVTITPRNDAPANTAVPTVTGTKTVGQTLTATTGTWNDTIDTANGGTSTITYAYLWQRADNASGANTVDITTATAVTYVLAAGDAGKYVRVRVTGTDNGIGLPATQSTIAYSAWSTSAVTVTNTAPSISMAGTATVILPASANLSATVTDDGLPSATLTQLWTVVSGPGTCTFGSATATSSLATFSDVGIYTLRLTAQDGALTTQQDMTVQVRAAGSVDSVTVEGSSGSKCGGGALLGLVLAGLSILPLRRRRLTRNP